MVTDKKKKKNAQQPTQRPKKAARNRGGRTRPGAFRSGGGAVASHARMLLDPCNGPMVHPMYGMSQKGILMRFTKTFTIGASNVGTTPGPATAGVFYWSPAVLEGNVTGAAALWYAVAQNSSNHWNNPVPALQAATDSPGQTYVKSVAGKARTVAACMRVEYAGSELNRSGFISMKATDLKFNNTVLASNGISGVPIDTLAASLGHRRRITEAARELIWVPNVPEQAFNSPSDLINADDPKYSDFQSLSFAYSGVFGNAGISVTCTSVIEWIPANDGGSDIRQLDPPTASEVGNYSDVVKAVYNAMPSAQDVLAGVGRAAGAYRAAAMMGNMRLQ